MTTGSTFNPWRVFQGAFIPNPILKSKELSFGSKLCYARLLQFAGKDGRAYPSVATLAEEIAVEQRQARRYLKELEDFGLIRRVFRKNEQGDPTSSVIDFLWHPIFDEDGQNCPKGRADQPVPHRADQPVPPRAGLTAEENHTEEIHSEESVATPPAAATHRKGVGDHPENVGQVADQMLKAIASLKKGGGYLNWHPDVTSMAHAFMAYYAARGWCWSSRGKQVPLKRWEAAATGWVTGELKRLQAKPLDFHSKTT